MCNTGIHCSACVKSLNGKSYEATGLLTLLVFCLKVHGRVALHTDNSVQYIFFCNADGKTRCVWIILL